MPAPDDWPFGPEPDTWPIVATGPTPPRRLRLTGRGRRTLVGGLVVAVVCAAAGALRFVGPPGAWADAGPPCTVLTAAGVVALEPDDAKRLSTAALARRSAGLSAADRAVVTALSTRDGALSCRLSRAERSARESLEPEALTRSGLTPRAEALRVALRARAGRLPLGGFEPGGVTTGHMPGSAHYEGRAIDVFFRPVRERNSRRGWLVAQWLVAHADDLDVATVIFDDRVWAADRGQAGWRPYEPPQGRTDNPVLRHLDHVHVDVARGS